MGKLELESIKSRHISDEEWEQGWRLSCNSRVVGDATVFVPDIASAYQSRMKTADLSTGKEVAIFEELQANLKAAGVEFDNDLMALELQMDEPTLDDTMPDNERLEWAIKAAVEAEFVKIPFYVMVKLAHTLREHNFRVCVKGRHTGDTFHCLDLPDHHHLPELAQAHVHRVGDAIQPSHPLLPPSPPALSLSQHHGLF